MDIKLLLIDIDDTIFDSEKAYRAAEKACYKFIKKIYPVLTEKIFFDTYREAKRQIHLELNGTASMHNRLLYFQRMFEILGLPLNPELLDDLNELYWKNVYQNLKLFNGVRETLKTIKENNITIGIVSDLIAEIQIKKLKRIGISKYIDFIVTSEEAGKEKPHPSIFLLALRKANCLPKNAIMIGNSEERDIRGAKYLGIATVLFSNKKERKTEADFVVSNFKELLSILKIKKRNFKNSKIIAFDLMGTIFKEGHIIRNILTPLLKKKGIKISYQKVKSLYEDYSIGKITGDTFWKSIGINIEKELLDSIELEKNIIRIFNLLKKKGYELEILSNIPNEWGNYLVKKFGLDRYFSTIVFSGEYKTRKPDEKLYKIFLEKSKIKPENCYMVDDKIENLKEARFLLMKTIWKKDKNQKIVFIPDFIIEKLDDLKRIL